ncbi:MAG: AtpZ/AtpI family protein [Flavobacteriales bacterium]|nr:AtpZ/AtpI family protein [Flavobacteriales bacterium]MCB9167112.1 AtpZ/AtpI family protein [Flavobacteriales bacterium]
MTQRSDKEDLDKARKGYNDYLRYSALGLQMAGMILAGVLGGRWVDHHIGWKFPVFTLVLAFSGIAGAMVFLFKETGRR